MYRPGKYLNITLFIMMLIVMELNEHKKTIEKALNEVITDFSVVVTAVDFSQSNYHGSGSLRINCDIYKKNR
jgi:hypothetical protein